MAFVCNTTKWTDPNPNPDFNPLDLCQRSPYYQVEGRNILAGLRDSLDPMIQAQMGICGTNKDLLPATAATAVGVKYFAIFAVEDTVLETASIKDKGVAMPNWAGKVLTAGSTIYGEFSLVKIVSGFVRAYEHPFN